MMKSANWFLGDDNFPWEKIAREELQDSPEKQAATLVEMKQKLHAFQEKHPNFKPQTDDEFLMAFLRTRKFHTERAFNAFVNFHSIHKIHPGLLVVPGKGPGDYRHILQKGIVIIPQRRNPKDGSLLCFVFLKNFCFEDEDISHIINLIYYFTRAALRSPAFQTLGVRLVIDVEGVSMAFFRTLLKRFYNLKVLLVAHGCIPTRVKGIHVLNEYYGMVKYIYNLLWPFLTTKIRKRIHLHGRRFEELHEHIAPEVIPDGDKRSQRIDDSGWCEKFLMGRHDELVLASATGFQEV